MTSLTVMDLAASSLKKIPLLPGSSQSKKKHEPKTYVFDLKLGKSTDETYPEFSWADLVKDAKAKEHEEKKNEGGSVLDPYASDDEAALMAMAARFEQKYGNNHSPKPSKKKKRKREGFDDKGAGYDESDSFIDNTDAYDEIIPHQLQPERGGFYINSGQLDSKEVHISEEESSEEEEVKPISKTPLPKEKSGKILPVSYSKSGEPVTKKPRLSQDTPVNRSKISCQREKTKESDGPKKRPRQISSSSGDSSSSTSSSNSEDSSSSECEEKNKNESSTNDPDIIILNSSTPPPPTLKHKKGAVNSTSLINKVTIKSTTILPRRPKVKNVPLNPMLHRKEVPSAVPIKNSLPPATITPRKVVSPKEFIKPKPGNITVKQWGLHSSHQALLNKSDPTMRNKLSPIMTNTSSNMIKVPTPKASPTTNFTSPSTSSGVSSTSSPLSISAELAQMFSDNSEATGKSSSINTNNTTTTQAANSKSKQQIKSSSMYSSPEAVAKEILNRMATNNAAQKKKESPTVEPRPLPKLKHKSGYILEKQPQPQSPSPSTFSPKPAKVNLKHAATGNPLLVNSGTPNPSATHSYHHHNPATTATSKSPAFHSSTMTGISGIEITKVKKLPTIGAGITVTEVKDKPSSTSHVRVMTSSPSNFPYGNNNLKISAISQPAASIAQSLVNYTSVITSNVSTSSLSTLTTTGMKKSSTVSSSLLSNLTGDLSERFNVSNFLLNKQDSKSPGRIANFNVNTLLSSSSKPEIIPVSKVSQEDKTLSNNAARDRK